MNERWLVERSARAPGSQSERLTRNWHTARAEHAHRARAAASGTRGGAGAADATATCVNNDFEILISKSFI
ncbi:hypothetical protein EVAR_24196_1 [Eumeta japonica]|uniref:Uncharacterized protein n=1 Tax=Eumeta variegata TaxID=151549 RepID=A0A4C1W4S0_EUMVA|nr:hypothetical protein EVAR_24196_1 [Eumeta japonica]